jgi:hypothetical protein
MSVLPHLLQTALLVYWADGLFLALGLIEAGMACMLEPAPYWGASYDLCEGW